MDQGAPTDAVLVKPPTVLVVDDNEINRIICCGLVELLGFCVRTANDGLAAIDQCRQMPPLLVLMDLDMPVLGGLDATRRLRALQSTGEIPLFVIIAVTADDTSREACAHAGMDGYLNKPLRLEALQAELLRLTIRL